MELEIKILNEVANFFAVETTKISVIEKLFGGMSNNVYKINVNNQFYTLRIPGKSASLFVDREIEFLALNAVKKLNLHPMNIYFNKETGVKIAPFIAGDVLVNVDIKEYLYKIAWTLKKLHNTELDFSYSYDLINRLNKYESYNDNIAGKYFLLKAQWLSLYEQKYKNDPQVFTHGDAQRSNFVSDGKQMYLFDFEYAGLNSIFYDIASFANVSFADSLLLLDCYFARKATKEEINHVRFYRIYQTLQWYQVALKKHQIGLDQDLNLDFSLLAQKYLKNAEVLMNEMED